MLEEYFAYLKAIHDKEWIHLNMNNQIFGFKAIKHRYEVLNGSSYTLPNILEICLSQLLANKNNLSPSLINLSVIEKTIN